MTTATPRAPRKRRIAEVDPSEDFEMPSTFDAALAASEDETLGFDALKALMDVLNAEDADSELAVPIYTRKSATSSWSLIDTWRGSIKSFDMDKLIGHIQSTFGNGDYKVTPRVKGRIIKHIPISLGDPRTPTTSPLAPARENNSEMMLAMMQMQQSSMLQMQQMQAQATAANQQMIGNIVAAFAPVITAIVSRPPTDPLAVIGPLAAALKPDAPREGIKDMIESAAALKTLIGGDGGSGGDDLMSLGAKTLPGLIEMGKQAMAQRPAPAPVPTIRSVAPAPAPRPTVQPPMRAIPIVRPVAIPTPEQRIVAMIRPTVLECMARDTKPHEAAAQIAGVLKQRGVTDDVLLPLAGKFVGPDPLSDLAALGLDLRAKPDWANAVITGLVAIFTGEIDASVSDDDRGGGDGDAHDVGEDGEAGA